MRFLCATVIAPEAPRSSMMLWFLRALPCAALLWSLAAPAQAAGDSARFACGGSVEKKVWQAWDQGNRSYLEQQLRERLLKHGDVYALYDFQTYAHNLAAMARRCNRTQRMTELGGVIRIAYEALERSETGKHGRRWVCRGGGTCNAKNRLLNTEVGLGSAQFLALAAALADALLASGAPLNADAKAFVEETSAIVLEHLLRWSGDATEITRLQRALTILPEEKLVGGSSSSSYFTDRELWQIALYADLAGILRAQTGSDPERPVLSAEEQAQLKRHLSALLRFFGKRLSMRQIESARTGRVDVADLDRAYWGLRSDSRYAGYEGDAKPVECVPSKGGKARAEVVVRVPHDTVPKRLDTGWDISHARRLVHALDALERNRTAITTVFSLKEAQLPPARLPKAFANALATSVWNGDRDKPLFANYWSGANGWYRVDYDNGTGACREGYPPYGMSDSFVTGGYIAWSRYQPLIGKLGARLYDASVGKKEEDIAFIARYYPDLSRSAAENKRKLAQLMFLPSLVGVGAK